MPRGGFRPGSGRKKNSVSALQAQQDKTPKPTVKLPSTAASAVAEPLAVLTAVMNGEATTPDGKPITPERVSVARDLLPFFTPKLATTAERKGADVEARNLTDDELAATIAAAQEVIDLFGRTSTKAWVGSGEGTAAAAESAG